MTTYKSVFFKWGFKSLLAAMTVGFIFGGLNGLNLSYGSSQPGFYPAIGGAVLMGIFVGPVVFLIAGLLGILLKWNRESTATEKVKRMVVAAALGNAIQGSLLIMQYAFRNVLDYVADTLVWSLLILQKFGFTEDSALLCGWILGSGMYGVIAYQLMRRLKPAKNS